MRVLDLEDDLWTATESSDREVPTANPHHRPLFGPGFQNNNFQFEIVITNQSAGLVTTPTCCPVKFSRGMKAQCPRFTRQTQPGGTRKWRRLEDRQTDGQKGMSGGESVVAVKLDSASRPGGSSLKMSWELTPASFIFVQRRD